MKSYFTFGLLFANLITYTQIVCDFSDDYSDVAPWTYFYNVSPLVGACITADQDGTLSIAGGIVDFDTLIDANDTRYYRDLGFTLSDESWIANFEFTPTDLGTSGGVDRAAAIIFALSAGIESPFNEAYDNCDISVQDGIMVVYSTDLTPTPSTTGFYIYYKDGDVWGYSACLPATIGSTYYCTLQRASSTKVNLFLYSDAERTDLINSINCLDIPAEIGGLYVLQHGNFPWGSYTRAITGYLDNTCIYTSDPIGFITGPLTSCESGDNPLYIFEGELIEDIVWELPASVDYTIFGDDSIVVNDWGGAGDITITVEVTVGCDTETYTYLVEVNPSDSTSEIITICYGDTISVFGTDVSDTGVFTHTFTAITGCDSIHTVIVELNDTIYTSEILTICEGDTVLIFGDPVYLEGIYSETYPSTGGCDSTHSIIVEFTDLFETYETISICDGEIAMIFGEPESEAGDYSQSYFSVSGCDSIHTITLEIFPPIDVYFPTDTVTCGPDGITLSPIITGIDFTIVWTPGGILSCDDCPNPFVIPNESGWYYITITDNNGCTQMDSVYVDVDLAALIELPNAFSPNNDGINDIFNILESGVCNINYFRIYNRWGEMIFETFDSNLGWDGTYKTVDQEIGTYVYVVDAICENTKLLLTGNVTLVR